MLIIIMMAWLIGITLILIFFRGATRKEKEMEINTAINLNKRNMR
ncbi:hypothetical protein R0131_04700 [Clostridium sp. AL.422]|nr:MULTISPECIES: hypothetical protein [unclassified Clostridium]MDV4150131.1 hypothetical protein [Clostridium sp. AL.422]